MMPRNQDVDRGGEAPSRPSRDQNNRINSEERHSARDVKKRRKKSSKKDESQNEAAKAGSRHEDVRVRSIPDGGKEHRSSTSERRIQVHGDSQYLAPRGKDIDGDKAPSQPRRNRRQDSIRPKKKRPSQRAIAGSKESMSDGERGRAVFFDEPEDENDSSYGLDKAKSAKGGNTKSSFVEGESASSSLGIAPDVAPPNLQRDRSRVAVPGAVAIGGNMDPLMNQVDEHTAATTPDVDSSYGSSAVSIINARVVDEETPIPMGPFVEAEPMPPSPADVPTQSLFKNRKVQIALVLGFLLTLGLTIGVVVALAGGDSTSNEDTGDSTVDEFLVRLEPLLSAESLAALDSQNTPQALSLQWLSQQSSFDDLPFDRKVQRYALGTFYYATSGLTWTDDSNWLTDDDECTWLQDRNGEVCDDGVLLVLERHSNGLRGTLPDELNLLSALTILDLGDNNISGTIPNFLGEFVNLKIINFESNSFSGTVPMELSGLTRLQFLSLSKNELTGTLSSDIGNLQSIGHLDASKNLLEGSIPSSIGQLTGLETINFSHNGLSRGIPTTVGQLKEIVFLLFFNNTLSGSIPSEIGQLQKMQALELDYNLLIGSIPTELGQCTSLTDLYLNDNSLSGTIPTTLGSLKQLELLELTENSLFGTVPAEVCELTAAYELTPEDLEVDIDYINCACCWDDEIDFSDDGSDDTPG